MKHAIKPVHFVVTCTWPTKLRALREVSA
jgi:hypothetical protein